jgi:flagellin FlaB
MIIDNKAQSGIGSMILFIAMLLVAAVGASTLIQASGKLQLQVAQTGGQGIAEVSMKLEPHSVVGYATDPSSNQFDKLIITVTLSPGSTELSLGDVMLSYQAGDVYISRIYYNSSASTTGGNGYTDFYSNDVQGDGDDLLEIREVLEFHFWIEDTAPQPLSTATEFMMTITPRGGTNTVIRAATPPMIRHNYTLI